MENSKKEEFLPNVSEQEIKTVELLEPAYKELVFEKEKDVVDFEREPVYDMNSFGGRSVKTEVVLAPPPHFEDAVKTLPEDVLNSFKTILHGDVVGIWPIKSKEVLK